MKFLFDDPSFSFETLRAVGYTPYSGADIGEMVATAGRIADGDESAWYTQWKALAERIEADADSSAAAGRAVSARESYLRASTYHRMSEFYLRTDPDHDPRVLAASRAGVAAFTHAAALLPQPLTPVRIPYLDTTLPGWWVPADDGTPDPRTRSTHRADGSSDRETSTSRGRPVLVFHGGFDSTVEELYFAGGAAAARRGYHALLIDGPGQGMVLREQHLPFRPDWEVVVTAAVDWLLGGGGDGAAADPPHASGSAGRSRSGVPVLGQTIDPDAIALMGMSMGGQLAPRAAAFEHRLAALIAYDGVYSLPQTMNGMLPAPIRSLLDQATPEADAQANEAITTAMSKNTQLRWSYLNGMWSCGAATPVELVRTLAPFTLDGIVQQIECPTLVLDAESDQFFAGQAETLRDALTAPVTYHRFLEADGAGEHCQDGAMSSLHRVVFDWLDETLAASGKG